MPLLLAGYVQFRFDCGSCGKAFKTFNKEEQTCDVCRRNRRRAPTKRKAVLHWVDEILNQ